MQVIRKFLLLVLSLTPIVIICNAQPKSSTSSHNDIKLLQNWKEYTVWSTIREYYNDEKGFEADRTVLRLDYNFVQSLPHSLKIIISKYITLLNIQDSSLKNSLAHALGKYSSLEEAQVSLGKQWNKVINHDKLVFYKVQPSVLILKETKNGVFFECSSGWVDNPRVEEFTIDKNNRITYIEHKEVLKNIPFSRTAILDYRHTHTIFLNGEEVDFYDTYPDPANVKSVQISERDKIIYITEKNKKPSLFSLSDIDISKLNFPVKSINEVSLVIINDGTDRGTLQYDNKTRMEKSAVLSVESGWLDEEKKVKYIEIRIRRGTAEAADM